MRIFHLLFDTFPWCFITCFMLLFFLLPSHLVILTLFFFLVTCCGPLSYRMPGRPRGHPAAALLFLWLPSDSEHLSGWGHGPPPAPVLLPPAALQELANFGPGRFGVPLRYCTIDAVPSAIMAGTVLLSALWNAKCAEKLFQTTALQFKTTDFKCVFGY